MTLVMALLFMAIWFQSLRTYNSVTYNPDQGPRQVFTASPGGLTWLSRSGIGQYVHGFEFMNLDWKSTGADDDGIDELDNQDGWYFDWNWNHCGFRFGRSYLGSDPNSKEGISLVYATISYWRIPHWSVVLLLTLISAWLLLATPGRPPQADQHAGQHTDS